MSKTKKDTTRVLNTLKEKVEETLSEIHLPQRAGGTIAGTRGKLTITKMNREL